MFASLKNKIKEETGSDLTKLAPILSSPPQKKDKGKHSRQGSASSLGSLSMDGTAEDHVSSPTSSRTESLEVKCVEGRVSTPWKTKRLEMRDDDWRRKLQKKDEEWAKKLEKKEEEWKKQMEDKQKEWQKSIELLEKEKGVLEEEKREVIKQKLNLEELVKIAEEYKRKVFQYQEDIDQLEGFQTQEMAKVKHLLLVKEQEVAEKTSALKESSVQIETLRSEVARLRHYEEELSNLQDLAAAKELKSENQQIQAEEHAKALEAERARLVAALECEISGNATLQLEVEHLREELGNEQARCTDLNIALDKEREEKDSVLIRNAQVNQQTELALQEFREQEQEVAELQSKVSSLEDAHSEKIKELEKQEKEIENLTKRIQELEETEHEKQMSAAQELDMRNRLSELEEQVAERNKTIRVLQQRLGDMKKTLQRELRLPPQILEATQGADGEGAASTFVPGGNTVTAVLTPSSSKQVHVQSMQHIQNISNNHTKEEDDVNFKYLKHVLIKFLTSREYEAQHLTRAVATLLRFSPEEERLLRETLDWKMSWFGTRPSLGFGQTAKTIPPS